MAIYRVYPRRPRLVRRAVETVRFVQSVVVTFAMLATIGIGAFLIVVGMVAR